LNSIELIDNYEKTKSTETSDYLVSGDNLAEEESKEPTGRQYKVVRSLLDFQVIIIDYVVLART
jgi:hypothetical protein